MNEINWISLYIDFSLIIIKIEYLFWLSHPPSFSYFAALSLLGLFCLAWEFLLLLLIEYGFTTCEGLDFEKNLRIL